MIYPTRRAIVLALAGAPVMLAVGVVAPGFWLAGVVWATVMLLLLLVDAALGADRRRVEAGLEAPHGLAVGAPAEAMARIGFPKGPAPGALEARLETGERIEVQNPPAPGRRSRPAPPRPPSGCSQCAAAWARSRRCGCAGQGRWAWSGNSGRWRSVSPSRSCSTSPR